MIESFKMNCFKLNRAIRVTINLPDNYYNSNRYYSSIFFLDGQNLYDEQEAYSKKALHIENVISELLKNEKEAIFIGIWAANHEERRQNEFEHKELADFIIHTIYPFLSERYRLNHFQYSVGIQASSYTALLLSENELFKGSILFFPKLSTEQIHDIALFNDKLYYIYTNSKSPYFSICLDIKEKSHNVQLIYGEEEEMNQNNMLEAFNYVIL